MIYLVLFALLILILGVYAYTRKTADKKTIEKEEKEVKQETKPEEKNEEKNEETKTDDVDKEFNPLTDCVNPKVLDEGECYKNTEGRWKVNQIKSFTDTRCTPQRIVDDCPPERVEKLKYDCSPDEQSFCKNAVGQLKNCKDRRTPVTTNEQDLALVRSCGLKGLMSPDEYKQAQDYFTTKGLTLPNLPDVNCTDFSEASFCKNPTARMQNCREIQTSPSTDQKDLDIIRKCGANSDAISDAEYKKAQEYFSAKGLTLPNRPTVNCMDNSTQNFCTNPREQVEQCKFMRNTTDEEDFKRVQSCYASMIRSQLSPEELQKFDAAKEYFKTKNMNLILPDVNCMDKTTENFCKNPVSQMTMCQEINGGIISKEQNLKLIQTCARENKITDEQYKQTQAYLKTQGIDIPDKPDVNCTDLSKDAFCKNPIERILFCNELTPTEQELNTYLSSVKDCMLTKKIDQDKYKQAQDFFKQKNLKLSDWSDVNCANETEDYFCKNASNIIANCNGIRETNPEQYATLIRKCAFNGDVPEPVYNEAKTFLKTKNITLPDFPNVVCKTMRDDDFCKTPASYLTHCKDESTLKQDLETARFCGILGKTSQEEYKKAQDFFRQRKMGLVDLPDVDCKNTNEDMFCANPVSHMFYCGPMRNKTKQQDFDAIVECAKNNKISQEQYNKSKEYFEKRSSSKENYILPEYPTVVCNDPKSFCKDPVEFIEFCKPKKLLPQLLNDVKTCKINNTISDEAYKKAQVYFNSKGLILPNMPVGVDCNNITSDSFCKTPMDHINYCAGTGIKDFTDNINFDRVKKCVLDRNITPLEYDKANIYFRSRGIGLPKIPDVPCSDEVNANKFCTKPISFIEQCQSVRNGNANKDFDTIINCMKNKQISEGEYNIANEYFKKKIDKPLPPFETEVDCRFIKIEELCSQPLSFLQKCPELTSPGNIENTKNLIISCSKRNMITQYQYDQAKTILTDLPKYESFNCKENTVCSNPFVYIDNCKAIDKKAPEDYKNDIIQCAKDRKINEETYNKFATYLKNTSAVNLPVYEELIADCNNICSNPVGTLKYCSNRKFTLDQEVQQINQCILDGKFKKDTYDAIKTYLDANKDKLQKTQLIDFKYVGCVNNCKQTDTFCKGLSFCLECNAVSNFNNPIINKEYPSPAELARGQLCSIDKYPELSLQMDELIKKYPDQFKPKTKTFDYSCDWKCENGNTNCQKKELGNGMCEFTYIPKKTCLPDNATIYVGCGFAYGSKEEAVKQCGKTKISEYSLVTLGDNPCKLSRASPSIYLTQCKNKITGKYNAYMNRNDIAKNTSSYLNCADGGKTTTVRWIGDGL